MLRALAISIALSFCAAQASAEIWLSLYRGLNLDVNRVSATRFEVIERRGAGAADIWCAAALFAEQTLGQTRGRIYVDTPRGPAQTAPGRKGVIFTTQAPANASTSVSVSVRQAGQGLRIAHAIQFCRNHIIEPGDRF